MNTLVYGFGPYGKFTHNVTTDIIQAIDREKIARGVVFEVRFRATPFLDALERWQPDLVIGLGQHPRARKIRIERRARNWQADHPTAGKPIDNHGPKCRYASLKIPPTDGTTVTYDAGSYVCNYSMYLMCRETERMKVPYAFLHVPLDVDVGLVLQLVEKIVIARAAR